MESSKRILVIGAAGGVGKLICREVMRQIGPDRVIVGDYIPQRGEEFAGSLGENVVSRFVDVNDSPSIEESLEDVGAVIVAARQKEPRVQMLCVKRRILCLDITLYPEFIPELEKLHEDALARDTALVVGAGLFPGLSGIMAKHACANCQNVESIDVGMVQNSNAAVGAAGTAAMLGLLAQPVMFRKDGEQYPKPGFTVKRTFDFPKPFGEKTLRLIDYYESSVVAKECNVENVNYWTCFDKPGRNALLVLLNKLRFLKLFNLEHTGIKLAKIINSLRREDRTRPEVIALTAEVLEEEAGWPGGARVTIAGPSDYGATAMSVVAMATLILDKRVKAAGVCFPLEIFPLRLLLETINSEDLKIYEQIFI